MRDFIRRRIARRQFAALVSPGRRKHDVAPLARRRFGRRLERFGGQRRIAVAGDRMFIPRSRFCWAAPIVSIVCCEIVPVRGLVGRLVAGEQCVFVDWPFSTGGPWGHLTRNRRQFRQGSRRSNCRDLSRRLAWQHDWRRHAGFQAPRKVSEFPANEIQSNQDQPGAGHHGPCQDHRVAEAEFLDRNPENDREKADTQNDRSADQ